MLYIEPNAGPGPVLDVIEHAQRVVDLNVYEITSAKIELALKAACRRGVTVRVMIDMKPYRGQGTVAKEKAALGDCIDLKGAPPRFTARYTYDHAKYVIADPASAPTAEVGTANYSWSAFNRNREYLWVTTEPKAVTALARVFDADWNRRPAGAGPRGKLILSPHSGPTMQALIAQPGSVAIEAEELGSAKGILAALKAKAGQLRLILPSRLSRRQRRNAKDLAAAGVRIRLMHSPYMHAKMIVGHTYGFIGSQNFSAASLERNREVGVAFRSKKARNRLRRQFESDWKASQPL